MNEDAATVATTHCPHCGDSRIAYKNKASIWECQNCEERFAGAPPATIVRRLGDRAVRPKAIFFSYGHDDNRELVLSRRCKRVF